MGEKDEQGIVTMHELLISSLATADALAKLLIEKGRINEALHSFLLAPGSPTSAQSLRCHSYSILATT